MGVHRDAWAGQKTVLLVEDEADVRESIVDVLHAMLGSGMRVLAAGSAEEGLALLSKHGAQLVISDYRLPGMDGLRFLQEARRLAPHAPRILITAYVDLHVLEADVAAAGLEAVVAKPMDMGDLAARVAAALAKVEQAPKVQPAPAVGRFVRDA